MRRLSIKQNSLLDQLREQGKRIEKLSRIEHDLIKGSSSPVGEIKEGMEEMIAVVKEEFRKQSPGIPKERALGEQEPQNTGSICNGYSWPLPRERG